MNFIRKIDRNGEEEEEEKQTPQTVDRFLSSYQHSSRYQPQQQPFFPPPPYHRDGEPSRTYEEEGVIAVEREHMFDKVVTPSDVGKLNRLVIPKQHAERYFPLDSSSTDKGLLLNFEDMNGKMWRFRYSYWNSSQSYVMTKGWSRFVKEKNLDAGDVVSFQRGVGVSAKDRLFIDWRRRVTAFSQPNLSFSLPHHNHFQPWNPLVLKSHPAVPRRNPNLMPPTPNTSENVNNGGSRSVFYFRPGGGYGTQQQHFQMIQMPQRNGFGFGFGVGMNPLPPPSSPTPQLHGKSSSKRLRLFGVNMDCPLSEDERDQTYDPPSQTIVAGCNNYGDYTHGVSRRPPVIPPPSSSSSIPYLQLSPYGEGNESNQSTTFKSSSSHGINIIDKSTTCNMSLDLDI